jgi:hypothetical protein
LIDLHIKVLYFTFIRQNFLERTMLNGMPDFHQSVEMMKNMWSSAAKTSSDSSNSPFGFSGVNVNPFGIPMVDIGEIDKRIKDLKSVEAWLTLNLNILQTTIQGLEVQKATLSTLQGIAETMKASTSVMSSEKTPETKDAKVNPNEFVGASGKLAQDLMEQMSKSMTTMMSAFPTGAGPKSKRPRTSGAAKTTPAAKTAKPRSRQTRV